MARVPHRRLSMGRLLFVAVVGLCAAAGALAQPSPAWAPREGTFTIDAFRFQSGEVLPQLRLHYLTLGTLHRDRNGHADNVVLLLHGTGGDAHSFLTPNFAGELFGPGQPLDSNRYFLVFPDDIGHGASSKPSDGLHARFPSYDYDDMVRSQYTMLREGLNADHLRLILGTSMGCMQTFIWGESYPGFADALAPLACLPTAIAGRNRMLRHLAIEAIKTDPDWQGGEYQAEPLRGLRTANALWFIMGSSALTLQKMAPTPCTCRRIYRSVSRSRRRGNRCERSHLLFKREPRLRSKLPPRADYGAGALYQFGGRFHQPT